MPVSKLDWIEWRLISCELNALTGTNIVVIAECNPQPFIDLYQSADTKVRVNGHIENFQAKASLDDRLLPEIQLPLYDVESSAFQRAMQDTLLQHNSPRKHLNVYVSSAYRNWLCINTIAMLNPAGFPYFTYNLLEKMTDSLTYKIGHYDRIGIGVEAVGWGGLAGSDSIIIHGNYGDEPILTTRT